MGRKPSTPTLDLSKEPATRRHGGAQPGQQMALKHGIYDKFYTDEEIVEASRVGDVEAELRVCRIRLARAIKAEKNQEDALRTLKKEEDRDKTELQIEELNTEQSMFKSASGRRTVRGMLLEKRKFKRTNFHDVFERLLARIESLERTRHWLLNSKNPDDPDKNSTQPVTKIEVVVVKGKDHTKIPAPGTEEAE